MLTPRQSEILIGSLLGDGSIAKDRNGCCLFGKFQSTVDVLGADKHDYLQWHFDELHPLSSSLNPVARKRGDSGYQYLSKAFPDLKAWESKWYRPTKPRRTKIVPTDIRLTPLVLCVWFMDDGINYPVRRQAEFCTQSFTRDENEFLRERLQEDLGIKSKVQEFRGKCHLYIGPESYLTLIHTIKPACTWTCLRHKHDLSQYREQTYARGEINGHSRLKEADVLEIHRLHKSGVKQKELAFQFGVDRSVISKILSGKRWGYLLKVGVPSHASN